MCYKCYVIGFEYEKKLLFFNFMKVVFVKEYIGFKMKKLKNTVT